MKRVIPDVHFMQFQIAMVLCLFWGLTIHWLYSMLWPESLSRLNWNETDAVTFTVAITALYRTFAK